MLIEIFLPLQNLRLLGATAIEDKLQEVGSEWRKKETVIDTVNM